MSTLSILLVHINDTVSANDRDLQARSIPSTSCIPVSANNMNPNGEWRDGIGVLRGQSTSLLGSKDIHLNCGLQLNETEISNPKSNDNDISSVQIVYQDVDGRGPNASISVTLYKNALLPSGELRSTAICQWDSNLNGAGATTYTKATFPCVHDISVGAFYYFNVRMFTALRGDQPAVGFVGLTFPRP